MHYASSLINSKPSGPEAVVRVVARIRADVGLVHRGDHLQSVVGHRVCDAPALGTVEADLTVEADIKTSEVRPLYIGQNQF